MKVWVVSTVDGSSPFRVEVEEGWIVDDLRSAIADKKKFSYGSDLLKIRLDRDSQDLEEDVVVSTILETGSSKKNPFYFVEHEDHVGANSTNISEHGPAIGDKRHYDMMLSNIVDIAPSSFAAPTGKHSWSANYSELGLKCHRPTREQSGIHTSLMSREIGMFVDDVQEVQLGREDYTFTVRFCDAMCGVFLNEEARQSEANALLSEYFNVHISKLFGQGGWWNDGGVFVQCGPHKCNVFAVLFNEYKWEMCASKAAPGEQSIGYFIKMVHESKYARERSACPALLLTIAGPNLGVSAAVHGAGPCVDPVVPLLPTLVLKQDRRMMTSLARALKACKLCIGRLADFYSALSNSTPSSNEAQQLLYPYSRSFLFEGHEVPFAYDGQVGNKLVFAAHVTTGSGCLTTDLTIIVKFTATYCVEAHNLCYECDKSAPRLYSHSVLPGGWHMVVMEYLTGADFKPQRESDIVQNKLTQVVKCLNQAGLVHGDLRGNNVCVIGDRVCLLDFDWSGRAGAESYPGFMNHANIDWSDGASDGLPLQTAHDQHMLAKLVRSD